MIFPCKKGNSEFWDEICRHKTVVIQYKYLNWEERFIWKCSLDGKHKKSKKNLIVFLVHFQ